MEEQRQLTLQVKALAREHGFAAAGIAPAEELPGREIFDRWIAQGMSAATPWLQHNRQERFNPALLWPGAKSVICLAVPYAPPQDDQPAKPTTAADAPNPKGRVAFYARGRDYHKLLKRRCHNLMDHIRRLFPGSDGRSCVDSAPLAERSAAARAGLGWIGRHGCLIVPPWGSYVVLAEIVCNLPLVADQPTPNLCGDCRLCLDACPAGALCGDGTMDARRCASHLTIEHQGDIAPELRAGIGLNVFGCDACQQACPHNQAPLSPPDPALAAPTADPQPPLDKLLAWTAKDWDNFTRGSTRRRASLDQWLRNAVIAAGNSGHSSLAGPLAQLRQRRPELAELIDWAVKGRQ